MSNFDYVKRMRPYLSLYELKSLFAETLKVSERDFRSFVEDGALPIYCKIDPLRRVEECRPFDKKLHLWTSEKSIEYHKVEFIPLKRVRKCQHRNYTGWIWFCQLNTNDEWPRVITHDEYYNVLSGTTALDDPFAARSFLEFYDVSENIVVKREDWQALEAQLLAAESGQTLPHQEPEPHSGSLCGPLSEAESGHATFPLESKTPLESREEINSIATAIDSLKSFPKLQTALTFVKESNAFDLETGEPLIKAEDMKEMIASLAKRFGVTKASHIDHIYTACRPLEQFQKRFPPEKK